MGMLPKHETHQRIAEAFVLWVAYGKLVDDGQTELEVIASLVAPAVEPEEVAIYLASHGVGVYGDGLRYDDEHLRALQAIANGRHEAGPDL